MGIVKIMPQFDNPMVKYIKGFFEFKGQKNEETAKTYHSSISEFVLKTFGYTDVRMLKVDDLKYGFHIDVLIDYFSKLYNEKDENGKRKYKNTTIKKKQAAIRSFLRYMHGREVIEYNLESFQFLENLDDDSVEIEMIPKDDALEYSKYALEHERNGLEKSLLIETALETALRAKELLELEWWQFVIEPDGVGIKSNGENRGKGNKDYLDKISFEFHEKLSQLKKGNDNEKVFQLKYRTVADMMTRITRALGNEGNGYSFHSFRKTAVTEVYYETRCILAAQRKARHSDIKTTRRYLRIAETPVTGLMSRLMTQQEDVYNEVNQEILLSCIEKLPRDMKVLLNRYVHEYINK